MPLGVAVKFTLADAVNRRTRLVRYLDTARRMARHFLPADGTFPWAFNAPLVPPRPANISSVMIVTNGLCLAQQERSLSYPDQSSVSYIVVVAVNVKPQSLAALLSFEQQIRQIPNDSSTFLCAYRSVTTPKKILDCNQIWSTTPYDRTDLRLIIWNAGEYYFIKAGNDLLVRQRIASHQYCGLSLFVGV